MKWKIRYNNFPTMKILYCKSNIITKVKIA